MRGDRSETMTKGLPKWFRTRRRDSDHESVEVTRLGKNSYTSTSVASPNTFRVLDDRIRVANIPLRTRFRDAFNHRSLGCYRLLEWTRRETVCIWLYTNHN
jgi:hypothetical protein